MHSTYPTGRHVHCDKAQQIPVTLITTYAPYTVDTNLISQLTQAPTRHRTHHVANMHPAKRNMLQHQTSTSVNPLIGRVKPSSLIVLIKFLAHVKAF